MKTINSLENLHENAPCVLAVGFFDGVHLGHRAVIEKTVALAKAEQLTSCAMTFSVSEQEAPKANFSLLTTGEDQAALLEALGISLLFRPSFSSVCEISPEETVTELFLRKLNAKIIVAGADLHFGKGAGGDAALLKKLGAAAGLRVLQLPEINAEGGPVSSTRIRTALREGKIETANQLLGRPFGYAAEIIGGARLGRTLGFPTINQPIPKGLTHPPYGVYFSRVQMGDKHFHGVTNIGVKPTVGGTRPLAETNLLGVTGDYYGCTARLELLRFHRPEQKFPTLAALKAQVDADRAAAEDYFAAPERL